MTNSEKLSLDKVYKEIKNYNPECEINEKDNTIILQESALKIIIKLNDNSGVLVYFSIFNIKKPDQKIYKFINELNCEYECKFQLIKNKYLAMSISNNQNEININSIKKYVSLLTMTITSIVSNKKSANYFN